MNSLVVKKFYRDFKESEVDYLENILDRMLKAEVEFPPHVVTRMVERGLVPEQALEAPKPGYFEAAYQGFQDTITTLVDGVLYEISNEAITKTINPFRLVVANEFEGYTLFVKVGPQLNPEKLKILDVWKRKGTIPIYPPAHALQQFVNDWDIIESLETMFRKQRVSIKDFSEDGEEDVGILKLIPA